jgi:hypothetical protein
MQDFMEGAARAVLPTENVRNASNKDSCGSESGDVAANVPVCRMLCLSTDSLNRDTYFSEVLHFGFNIPCSLRQLLKERANAGPFVSRKSDGLAIDYEAKNDRTIGSNTSNAMCRPTGFSLRVS